VKNIIVMYMAFCGEKDRDFAACLKTLNNHVFWQNVWNTVIGWWWWYWCPVYI